MLANKNPLEKVDKAEALAIFIGATLNNVGFDNRIVSVFGYDIVELEKKILCAPDHLLAQC